MRINEIMQTCGSGPIYRFRTSISVLHMNLIRLYYIFHIYYCISDTFPSIVQVHIKKVLEKLKTFLKIQTNNENEIFGFEEIIPSQSSTFKSSNTLSRVSDFDKAKHWVT